MLDIRTSVPTFIYITSGKVHDVNLLNLIPVEVSAIYIIDKGYIDFERLFALRNKNAFFITRAKKNLASKRIYSHDVSKYEHIKYDQTIKLTGPKTSIIYPEQIRKIKFIDKDIGKKLVFITNNFSLSAITIADLYKQRWQIELFFKWIKQNLKIKSFYGNSFNAVKTQIRIAVSTYLLLAIIKKKLKIECALYTFLQVVSITIFEKSPIISMFSNNNYTNFTTPDDNQLFLFNF